MKIADIKPNPIRDYLVDPVDGPWWLALVNNLREMIRCGVQWEGNIILGQRGEDYFVIAGEAWLHAAVAEGHTELSVERAT